MLDRAQQELAQTNLAFDYELVRGKNNSVEEIRFRFTPVTSEVLLPSLPATAEWQKALLEVGVSASSIATIGELIERGEIEATYVQYVVQQQRTKSKQGKIKSLAGAIFTAITKGHSLQEYRQVLAQRQKAASRKPATTAASTPQFVRYRVQEARDAFDIMVRKKMAKGATFEENLQLVYLSQGFWQERDSQGIEWLVKSL